MRQKWQVSVIEGIGGIYEAKLQEAGIKSIEALLKACATKKEGPNLRKNTDLEKLILKWANQLTLSE